MNQRPSADARNPSARRAAKLGRWRDCAGGGARSPQTHAEAIHSVAHGYERGGLARALYEEATSGRGGFVERIGKAAPPETGFTPRVRRVAIVLVTTFAHFLRGFLVMHS